MAFYTISYDISQSKYTMGVKTGMILVLVATSTLVYLYHATHDFAWFMLHLVIAGLFVSFALTFTAIFLLLRLLHSVMSY